MGIATGAGALRHRGPLHPDLTPSGWMFHRYGAMLSLCITTEVSASLKNALCSR